jgi:hypothetical protein
LAQALRENREREQEREYARRWHEYHERQAVLHESLAAEHRRKALDLVGRA